MKYRILGALVCLLTLATAVIVPVLADEKPSRVHQHLDAVEKAECLHEDDCLCSHLPLVLIDTGGVEIPGKAVTVGGEDSLDIIGYTRTADGRDEIRASMRVVENPRTNNHPDDPAALESEILINVRGRTSRAFDKSNYAVRLIDDLGENNPQPVMGMAAHHEWALHGPYLDKTLMRNYMWYNIAGEIMDYAPNVRFCEVMINGEYMGVYVMIETITAGSDGARLSLTVNGKNDTYMGYLVEMVGKADVKEDLVGTPAEVYTEPDEPSEQMQMLSQNRPNPIKEIQPFSRYSYRTLVDFEIVYPGSANLTEEVRKDIELDLSDFQKALYSYDFDNPGQGYDEYIDVQNFVDYVLINEFTANYDAGWLSTFMYKDLDGKYRMCIWDFNSSCDNFQESYIDTQNFEMQSCEMFKMLMKDEDFVEKIIDRYWELRETYFSRDYLMAYIDDVVEYLGPAIDRNFEKWGYTFVDDYGLYMQDDRHIRSYDEAIEQMKIFIEERVAWLDRNIGILNQYCAESKIKKYNENAN